MTLYTINDFWIPRLGPDPQLASSQLVTGWSFQDQGLSTFKEAPLTLSTEEFGTEANPMQSSVILVSAPGAVGKSTLARQIAFRTGSVYVDLATADPVGGNTISGGLARSRIYSAWENGSITALVDGLDEALLKTTREGFEAFLSDVVALSEDRDMPTVLFGRTGSIQDAWLVLTDKLDEQVSVLEIGYFEPGASIDFAEARLKASYPHRSHPSVDRQALKLLLDGLRNQTASDGDRFAGYAPVLQAVAEHVGRETNPSLLVTELQQGSQSPVTLHSVISAILKREQTKLESLPLQESDCARNLYSPDEQLAHLVSRVYRTPKPDLPNLSAQDIETYANALETWVDTHPFIDGGTGTSSVVFQAVISARALKNDVAASEALRKELVKGDAANPFLYVFYTTENTEAETNLLPEEHIGVMYSSIRASLAQGDSASLLVEEPESDSNQAVAADVTIEISRSWHNTPITLSFETRASGTIRLGPHVKDVSITMPNARVEVGHSTESSFVAPVIIQCADLAIMAEKVIAETTPDSQTRAVYLQADEFSGPTMTTVPVLRNSVMLFVCWPGAANYPWTSFAIEQPATQSDDPLIDEALRRFRKFVVEFRSHKNGGLARSRHKIDSSRMTKGTGQVVLNAMLDAGIVTRDQARYYLDADRLGELTETTYGDYMAYQFGPKVIVFVQEALESSGL